MAAWGPAALLETDQENQQLSFYLAGVDGDNLFFETNNPKLRCSTLSKDASLDLVLVEPNQLVKETYNFAESVSVQSSTNSLNRFLTGISTSSPFD